ncbi:myosin-2 heavy chain-like [Narcine bancroftii]|uniref:myosin-2 heavy chain-like n=1 Tax=Narcine bancroftii TaxID=1343680 RepID=UPI003831D252
MSLNRTSESARCLPSLAAVGGVNLLVSNFERQGIDFRQNLQLAEIGRIFEKYQLQSNQGKTMIRKLTLLIGGLSSVDGLRDPGVRVQRTLNAAEHVDRVVDKVYGVLAAMNCGTELKICEVMWALYNTLDRLQLEYSVHIRSPGYRKDVDATEKCEKNKEAEIKKLKDEKADLEKDKDAEIKKLKDEKADLEKDKEAEIKKLEKEKKDLEKDKDAEIKKLEDEKADLEIKKLEKEKKDLAENNKDAEIKKLKDEKADLEKYKDAEIKKLKDEKADLEKCKDAGQKKDAEIKKLEKEKADLEKDKDAGKPCASEDVVKQLKRENENLRRRLQKETDELKAIGDCTQNLKGTQGRLRQKQTEVDELKKTLKTLEEILIDKSKESEALRQACGDAGQPNRRKEVDELEKALKTLEEKLIDKSKEFDTLKKTLNDTIKEVLAEIKAVQIDVDEQFKDTKEEINYLKNYLKLSGKDDSTGKDDSRGKDDSTGMAESRDDKLLKKALADNDALKEKNADLEQLIAESMKQMLAKDIEIEVLKLKVSSGDGRSDSGERGVESDSRKEVKTELGDKDREIEKLRASLKDTEKKIGDNYRDKLYQSYKEFKILLQDTMSQLLLKDKDLDILKANLQDSENNLRRKELEIDDLNRRLKEQSDKEKGTPSAY